MPYLNLNRALPESGPTRLNSPQTPVKPPGCGNLRGARRPSPLIPGQAIFVNPPENHTVRIVVLVSHCYILVRQLSWVIHMCGSCTPRPTPQLFDPRRVVPRRAILRPTPSRAVSPATEPLPRA